MLGGFDGLEHLLSVVVRCAAGYARALTGKGTKRVVSRSVSTFVTVALAYALGAQLAYDWFGAGVFPVFFPAAGVMVAALVLTRQAAWPVVLAGAGMPRS